MQARHLPTGRRASGLTTCCQRLTLFCLLCLLCPAGLLESGCTDFLRVGPLRRLSRRLLAHSLHASESRATASAASELKEMLKEASGPAELTAIRAELAAVERGTLLGGIISCSSLTVMLSHDAPARCGMLATPAPQLFAVCACLAAPLISPLLPRRSRPPAQAPAQDSAHCGRHMLLLPASGPGWAAV